MIPLVTRIAAVERRLDALEERDRGGYLSMKDAAAYLGISRATVKYFLREGRIPFIKMGSGQNARVLIARREIQRYLNKHTVPAVNGAALGAAVSVRVANERAPRRWSGSFE